MLYPTAFHGVNLIECQRYGNPPSSRGKYKNISSYFKKNLYFINKHLIMSERSRSMVAASGDVKLATAIE